MSYANSAGPLRIRTVWSGPSLFAYRFFLDILEYVNNHGRSWSNCMDTHTDLGYLAVTTCHTGIFSWLQTKWTAEAVLTSTHNLCFWAEIRKIMYTPVNPSFTFYYTKEGLRGWGQHYIGMFSWWRLKSTCAFTQSDQSSLFARRISRNRPVKNLIRLLECAGWSEFLLGA